MKFVAYQLNSEYACDFVISLIHSGPKCWTTMICIWLIPKILAPSVAVMLETQFSVLNIVKLCPHHK